MWSWEYTGVGWCIYSMYSECAACVHGINIQGLASVYTVCIVSALHVHGINMQGWDSV